MNAKYFLNIKEILKLAKYLPVKCIAIALIIHWYKIHHKHVVCHWVHTINTNLVCGKHAPNDFKNTNCNVSLNNNWWIQSCRNSGLALPSGFSNNHFCSKLIKFIPQSFHFQRCCNINEFRMERKLSPVVWGGRRC